MQDLADRFSQAGSLEYAPRQDLAGRLSRADLRAGSRTGSRVGSLTDMLTGRLISRLSLGQDHTAIVIDKAI
jgi:hypothetical protein